MKAKRRFSCGWDTYVREIGRVHARLSLLGLDAAMTGYRQAARMRGLFEIYGTLKEMGPAGRRFVGSCADSLAGQGDFGSMRARGGFGGLLDENVKELDKALKGVPMEVESNSMDPDILEQARVFLVAANKISGIGVAGASRILCSKRPDRFLCLNGDNVKGLCEETGYECRAHVTVDDYLEIMAQIQQYPWYQAPQKSVKFGSANEQALWSARTAFFDHLVSERYRRYVDRLPR